MQIGHEMLLRLRSSHEILIEGILPLYDVVERCWPLIERLCGATPRVAANSFSSRIGHCRRYILADLSLGRQGLPAGVLQAGLGIHIHDSHRACRKQGMCGSLLTGQIARNGTGKLFG
jgi:hypothetical protein